MHAAVAASDRSVKAGAREFRKGPAASADVTPEQRPVVLSDVWPRWRHGGLDPLEVVASAVKKSHRPRTAPARAAAPRGGPRSRRNFLVFISLTGLLSLTSILLLALAPAPLTAEAAGSLFAIDQRGSMDAVFNTDVPVTKRRWNYIYVHQSKAPTGNAATLGARPGGLADHFVIGNGTGCIDGEVQIGHRWTAQLDPGAVPGLAQIRGDCISICVVGDLDRTPPSPTQRLRLIQLVHTLQSRLGVAAARVYLHQGTGTAADAGRQFPAAAFREQLLP